MAESTTSELSQEARGFLLKGDPEQIFGLMHPDLLSDEQDALYGRLYGEDGLAGYEAVMLDLPELELDRAKQLYEHGIQNDEHRADAIRLLAAIAEWDVDYALPEFERIVDQELSVGRRTEMQVSDLEELLACLASAILSQGDQDNPVPRVLRVLELEVREAYDAENEISKKFMPLRSESSS